MKRDVELARLILMRIEAQENYHDNISCEFEGYTDEQVYYHIMLLHEAGLVNAMRPLRNAGYTVDSKG